MSRQRFRLSAKLLMGFALLGLVMLTCFLAPLGPALRLAVQSEVAAGDGTETLRTSWAIAHVARDTVHHAERFAATRNAKDASLVRGRIDQLESMLRRCRTATRHADLSATLRNAIDKLEKTLVQFEVAFAESASQADLLRTRYAELEQHLTDLERQVGELRNRQHWKLYNAVRADRPTTSMTDRTAALTTADTMHNNVLAVRKAVARAWHHDDPSHLQSQVELLEDLEGLTLDLNATLQSEDDRALLAKLRTQGRTAHAAAEELLSTWATAQALDLQCTGPADALLGRAMVTAELATDAADDRTAAIALAARRLRNMLLISLAVAVVLGLALTLLVTAAINRDVRQVTGSLSTTGANTGSATDQSAIGELAGLERMRNSVNELNQLVNGRAAEPTDQPPATNTQQADESES